MEKTSDKGPIFAQGESVAADPELAKLLETVQMVLEVLGDEFAWAAREYAPPVVEELAKTWAVGDKGVELVRAFLRNMARGCFSGVADDGGLESVLAILRESRVLIGGA